MRVTVRLENVALKSQKTEIVQLPEDATIKDIFHCLGIMPDGANIKYKNYYSFVTLTFQHELPYLIKDNCIQWNVPDKQALLADFFKTHNITDASIDIEWGYPLAGGPGFPDIITLWQYVYVFYTHHKEIIDLLSKSVVTGIGIQVFPSLVKQIQKVKEKIPKSLEKVKPDGALSLVASREQWGVKEFSDISGLPTEDAKNLLVLCKYEYDRKRRMYIQTDETKEIVSALGGTKWAMLIVNSQYTPSNSDEEIKEP